MGIGEKQKLEESLETVILKVYIKIIANSVEKEIKMSL